MLGVWCVIMSINHIYRTLNPSLGIMKFESDSKAIGVPVFADSLQVSPAGNRATVVVVSLNRRYLYVSRDYAHTFDQYKTPTVNFDPTEELYLSSVNPQYMVMRSQAGEVCYSVLVPVYIVMVCVLAAVCV